MQALAQWGGKSHVEIETLDIGQSVANGILERAKREEVQCCSLLQFGLVPDSRPKLTPRPLAAAAN